MASGLSRAASKHSSAKSLGSFVEVGSVSSSEFEPVDLEEEVASQHAFSMQSDTSSKGSGLAHVNTTPASAPLRSVPEQSEIKPSPERQLSTSDPFTEPLQDGLQNLENATHKAAEMAKDFTSKILVSGAAEARSSVMKLAGDVSSWWAALDPGAKPQAEPHEQTPRISQVDTEVRELFGLAEDEELMEKFACTLVQSMECSHNSFSQPEKVQYPGKLYITDKHSCFTSEKAHFALKHGDIQKALSSQGSAKALRLEFGSSPRQHIELESFKDSELDSALALLEHLTESL